MSTRAERTKLIRALEKARGATTVIAYVTSTRPNLEVQMAMDVVPVFYRHLKALKTSKGETKVDLFLHSNGGDGVVPWRLVTLIREFCSEFSVLVPHRAFSAATLMALGADHVIMHPMGMLGPTDPTITTPFNPPNPQNPAQRLGISVEDVASYIALVKEDVGIRHEEEVVKAFAILAHEIHPLALGSVKRGTAQSRMLAERLLRQRLGTQLDAHELTEIIEKLTSRLFFHGHPINRNEARDDLRLNFVDDASPTVEAAMWNLYEAYSGDMLLDTEFNPLQEAYAQSSVQLPNPPQVLGPQQIVPSIPSVEVVELDRMTTAYVESGLESDVSTVEWEVVLKRDWDGTLEAKFTATRSGWNLAEVQGVSGDST
jgi:ClpP class serine protease